MKYSSQVVLTALLPTVKNQPGPLFLLEELTPLLETLSLAGARSLLYLLEQQQLVSKELSEAGVGYRSTLQGVKALEAEISALSHRYDHWEGDWSVLVFLTAPKSDPSFRYLRRLLVSQGALGLNRGVYLGAGGFSDAVMLELEQRYSKSVVLCSLNEWQIGAERPIVINFFGLNDILQSYSGISTQVARLTSENTKKSDMKDQSKKAVAALFHQFLGVVKEDPGFSTRYISLKITPFDLLAKLQRLLLL